MAALSRAAQERLFVLGVCFGAGVALGYMRRLLIHYRDDAMLPPVENKPQYITQNVEDALKVSTLGKLLDSPNYCIQETAAIIICERALHDDDALNTILHHATRPDYDTRERGIRSLTYVVNSGTF
jgi:hypothetical protein